MLICEGGGEPDEIGNFNNKIQEFSRFLLTVSAYSVLSV